MIVSAKLTLPATTAAVATVVRTATTAAEATGVGTATSAAAAGIPSFSPHDLRRTCARLCHVAGGELDQIQFLLGHVSSQTTERYLGCKRKLRIAVNDRLRSRATLSRCVGCRTGSL